MVASVIGASYLYSYSNLRSLLRALPRRLFETDLFNSFVAIEEFGLKAFIGDFEELIAGDFTSLWVLGGLSVFISLSRFVPNPNAMFFVGVTLISF
jgi:hypothetical protein